jgi:DNA relaxase NicK
MTIKLSASSTNYECETSSACLPAAKRGRTAGVQSPHVVKRGETLPHINSVSKSSEHAYQVAHIDWLAFTLIPSLGAEENPILWLLPQLREIFSLPDFVAQSLGKGWNGYTNRVNLGDGARYGLIAYGGEKQRGTVHVELNAMACAHVSSWHTVQQWGESLSAKITRVDLAHDDMQGDAVNIEKMLAWHKAGEFTTSGRPPKLRLIDDLGSGEGKTFYVGNRANGKLLRGYEKGKQLGDPSSQWFRAELELHNKGRVIPWDVLTTPSTYLAGGYPCLAFLSAEQSKIRTISKAVEITIGSMEHYLRTAGGKSINVLMQVHGGDAFALVNSIKRDGVPRRLVNYADFLPQILEGSGS